VRQAALAVGESQITYVFFLLSFSPLFSLLLLSYFVDRVDCGHEDIL
jgi:hypothetical protein